MGRLLRELVRILPDLEVVFCEDSVARATYRGTRCRFMLVNDTLYIDMTFPCPEVYEQVAREDASDVRAGRCCKVTARRVAWVLQKLIP